MKKIKNFKTIKFPKQISCVYIIYFIKTKKETPFYVGKTDTLSSRIGDYQRASRSASTDFKVGEAIKYLQEKKYKVIIKYRISKNRSEEEKEIIRQFQDLHTRLLNELTGYPYKKTDIEKERRRIINFCDYLIK